MLLDTDSALVSLADVVAAQRGLGDLIRRTPLMGIDLPGTTGPTLIKAENLQVAGSFKFRGACNALHAAVGRGADRVITYSAGNHGRALARAARLANMPATVVMPQTASEAKIRLTRQDGAEVVLVEPDELVPRTLEIAEQQGAALVHPFDDPAVIAGQGTVGLELLQRLNGAELDTVLVPVGGGGLVSGIAAVMRALRPEIEVIAVEPELAADLSEGFAHGSRVEWGRARTFRTIADGLRSPQVGEITWRHISALVDDAITVSEAGIVTALRAIAAQTNTVVEPSAAVAVAAVMEHGERFTGRRTAAIVTGGNIDAASFAALLA